MQYEPSKTYGWGCVVSADFTKKSRSKLFEVCYKSGNDS
jgi:hypothetical protein